MKGLRHVLLPPPFWWVLWLSFETPICVFMFFSVGFWLDIVLIILFLPFLFKILVKLFHHFPFFLDNKNTSNKRKTFFWGFRNNQINFKAFTSYEWVLALVGKNMLFGF